MDVMRSIVLPECRKVGLFPRVYTTRRHDRIAFSPPLIITQEQADEELNRLYPIIAGLKDLKTK